MAKDEQAQTGDAHEAGGETDLAAFCAGDRSYLWLRADQTALLSAFTRNPPPSVRVVSFSVTADSDRDAFQAAVAGQLAAPGANVPDMLAAAAAACVARKQRLVLVVAGLDADAHGIAALLPASPPPGLRVIVTGRPHALADEYRRAHWPVDTPEFLLHDYFRLLRADGDVPRMTACALDPARHDRMLAVTGTDTAALAEIAAAQDAHLAAEEPDLRTMALLAVRHDGVVERNHHIPAGLPAVWALLGHPARARALARSVADPGARVEALVGFADALRDEHPAAAEIGELLGEAAAVAGAIAPPSLDREDALTAVAKAAARAGNLDLAVELAGEMAGQRRQALTLTGVADAGARAGDTRGAAAVASGIADARGRFSAQRAVARAAAEAGDVDFGVALARGIDEPDRRADLLRDVAEAAARGGHVDAAAAVARDLPDLKRRMWTLGAIATTVAAAGDLVTAAELATEAAKEAASTDATASRAWAYATSANLWQGDLDAAMDFADMLVFPADRAEALVEVAAAMSRAGALDRARTVVADAAISARAVDRTGPRARALAGVVRAAVLAGDADQARRLATEAWTLSRSEESDDWDRRVVAAELVAMPGDTPDLLLGTVSDPRERDRVSAEAAEIALRAGNLDRAEALARTITDPEPRARAITAVARAAVRAGHTDLAEALAHAAETTARTHTLSRRWAMALADAADAVARAGDLDRARDLATAAETFARATTDPRWRAQTLASAAKALARAGSRERAMDLVADVETLIETFANHQDRQWVHATVAKVLAYAGKPERALTVAHGITNRLNRAPVLYEIIAAVARTGDLGHARGLVLSITDPFDQQQATAAAARAAARAGHLEHAIVLARDAEAMAQDGDVDSWRARTLAAAATAAARAGDAGYAHRLLLEAAAAARSLPDDRRADRVRSLARVAQAAVPAGDVAHATSLVHEAETDLAAVADSAGRSWALQEIVTAALLAGDTAHADTLATGLSPHLRGRAAADAARFVRAGQARPLLAKALRLTDWRNSIEALAVVEPAVLTEIARQLVADADGR